LINIVKKINANKKIMRKILHKTIFVVLIIVCSFSFISYFFFANKSNIHRVTLKQGLFKITNEIHEFKLNKLDNKTYNFVLNFYVKDEIESSSLKEKMFMLGKYNINLELLDENGNILKHENHNDGSKMPSAWSEKYVEWFLLQFEAKKKQSYVLRVRATISR